MSANERTDFVKAVVALEEQMQAMQEHSTALKQTTPAREQLHRALTENEGVLRELKNVVSVRKG